MLNLRSCLKLSLSSLVIFNVFAWATTDTWRVKMGELSSALSETIPYLYPDPKQDSKALTEKVKRIYEITKQLDGKLTHSSDVPDQDPALPYIAGLLNEDIERAYQSLQDGRTDYAKSVLRSSVSYCVACHTRTQMGVEFPLLKAFAERLKNASWIDKIEFQTASRQFDPVLTDVMQKLDSPGNVGVSPLDLERASRLALSILVRFKQDPIRANFLATSVLKSKNSTFSMKQAAQVWLKDIRTWQAQKDNQYATDKDLINAAAKLSETSDDLPVGAHTEVRFLRVSVLMHDLMRRFPSSPHTAQALYLVGQSYDSLAEIGLWSLPEMYYMACIKKAPHTPQSEACFKKYEQNVTLGYTGSSGTHIPDGIRRHIKNVKELAKMKRATL